MVSATLLAGLVFVACQEDAEVEQTTPSASPSPSVPPFPDECGAVLSDGEQIAYRILASRSDDLILPPAEFDALAAEAGQIISRVQSVAPNLSGIHPFAGFSAGQILIGTDAELTEAIVEAMGGAERTGPLTVGNAAFDELGGELGLTGMWLLLQSRLLLCVGSTVNIERAAAAYELIAGVLYASPNFMAGDAPDIAAEKVGETWYVVFREASGDCPAGCISQSLYYFRVNPSDVREVAEADALTDPILRRLAETWGAQRLPTPSTAIAPESLPKTGNGR
jgi:hypothetical protein